MANELKGKSTASITWIAPNESAVEALRIFFEGHYEFMRNKSYREGPLKLVQYVVSESPEYAGFTEFFDGKYPKKQEERYLTCLKSTKLRMDFTITGSKLKKLLKNSGQWFKHITWSGCVSTK